MATFITDADEPAPSTFESLPKEILQAIMKHLDFESLPKMVVLGPVFYEAFKAVEGITMHQIALNEIGPELLPIATARYAAFIMTLPTPDIDSPAIPSDIKTVNRIDFETKFLASGAKVLTIPKSTFLCSMVHQIIVYHRHMVKISDECADVLIPSTQPLLSGAFTENPCTQSERLRINRALYILGTCKEWLLTLFNKYEPMNDLENHLKGFWYNFSPWDRYQVHYLPHLASLHNYPERLHEILRAMSLAPHEFPLSALLQRPPMVRYSILNLDRVSLLHRSLQCPQVERCWLLRSEQEDGGEEVSLSIDHILDKHNEEDTGPQSIWFWRFASRFMPIPDFTMFGASFDQSQLTPTYMCSIFLDRARLDHRTAGKLPTLAQMQEATKNQTLALPLEDWGSNWRLVDI
ncbi:hypothetical protein F5B20DRAFT_553346 [Whalleya microplaca]|nr:hypothetical protein F5B20DRAFT_553346 [Whalleya microplaca]